MCNRYENRGSVSHIRAVIREINRILSTTSATDNLAPQGNIYPDQDAPVLRNAPDGSVELTMARWDSTDTGSEVGLRTDDAEVAN